MAADKIASAVAVVAALAMIISSAKIREILKAIFRSPFRTSNVVPPPPGASVPAAWIAYDEDKGSDPQSPVTLQVGDQKVDFNVGDGSGAWGYYSGAGSSKPAARNGASRSDTDRRPGPE